MNYQVSAEDDSAIALSCIPRN